MPNTMGRFHLYSDTSKFATGRVLYQIHNGKPKLIAYAHKRLPEITINYSITQLELYGLAINIASFSHLLKKWISMQSSIIYHLLILSKVK